MTLHASLFKGGACDVIGVVWSLSYHYTISGRNYLYNSTIMYNLMAQLVEKELCVVCFVSGVAHRVDRERTTHNGLSIDRVSL